MKKKLVLAVIWAALVGIVGFFTGVKYQQSKQSTFFRQFRSGQGVRMGQVFRQGFRPINGEIISIDEKSITVKLQDGSSKIILFSEKTEIDKAINGTKEDLKVGEKVLVLGIENSDGSVTAQNIQINPSFRNSFFGI